MTGWCLHPDTARCQRPCGNVALCASSATVWQSVWNGCSGADLLQEEADSGMSPGDPFFHLKPRLYPHSTLRNGTRGAAVFLMTRSHILCRITGGRWSADSMDADPPPGSARSISWTSGPEQRSWSGFAVGRRQADGADSAAGDAEIGRCGYRSRIGVPPSRLYDDDSFAFRLVAP
jgi:hypothetical protein